MLKKLLLFMLIIVISFPILAVNNKIHHQITAIVNPETHFVEATDKITIPEHMLGSTLNFLLVKDLKVESKTQGVQIKLDASKITGKDFGMDVEDFSLSSSISQNKYRIIFNKEIKGKAEITLKFKGKINYELKQLGGQYARGFKQTPGIISKKGVYLAGSTYWVPWFSDDLITYDLEVTLPESWDVVSNGKRIIHKKVNGKRIVKWEAKNPTEEVFLIAAEFNEYDLSVGNVEVMAFLRYPDENLANKYLETTAQYMKMYCNLIGPYPYSKFALIENFWETGYGMPSFTLLGSKIIRFPFILHSSYPHELLHNWWGNSVFVDFNKGNWCEGITVYMADHLIKEQRGQGLEYRREKLQRYTDYVTPENDFPVSKFLARNSASSEAVGYGKCMMFMDMLREKVGDKLFIKGFQKFYRDNKFKVASFDDICKAFEKVTNKEMKPFFYQWIHRVGAPELNISDVKLENKKKIYILSFLLKQVQKEDVFNLDVPIAISFEDEIKFQKVSMKQREHYFKISFQKKPLIIQVDPRFNLFRRLNYLEIPPSLSKIYGSENILVLLPSKAKKEQLDNYKKLSNIWTKNKTKKIEVKLDNEISVLPKDKDIWIMGHENEYRNIIIKGIADYDAKISNDSIRFKDTVLKNIDHSFVVSVRHPKNHNAIIAWLTIEKPEAINGISRKLMHYGKYSYLAFQGKDVTNVLKGKWQAVKSPMVVEIEKNARTKAFTKITKRKALAKLAPLFSSKRMMAHIKYLASDKLKGRGLGTKGIEKASEYIAAQFKKIGLKPGGNNGTYFQSFKTIINEKGEKGEVKNIIGFIPGTNKDIKEESVVVSAHFDHLGFGWPDVKKGNKGEIHNGADDNASGISVMLELAQMLHKTIKPKRSIVFIAFTAEENGLLGSKYYVKNPTLFPLEKVIGNINLDTVGRLFDKKVMVLNSASAREWKFIFMGASYVTGVKSEMIMQQITASDQKSFLEQGIPAVQIFSGAHIDYHTPEDDIDKIDAHGLVKVAAFVREGILYLADTEKFLTFKGKKKAITNETAKQKGSKKKKSDRRASTGIMPDFSYSGKGVMVASVRNGSAANKAGLKTGDIIIKLDKYNTTNLREYSNALKKFDPGHKIFIIFTRKDREIKTQIVLDER